MNLIGRNAGDSVYHSFQFKMEKRFGAGGSLLVSYTNAKLISNVDSATAWLEVGQAQPQNFYNLRAERSLALFDVPQRLATSYVLDCRSDRDRSSSAAPAASPASSSPVGVSTAC